MYRRARIVGIYVLLCRIRDCRRGVRVPYSRLPVCARNIERPYGMVLTCAGDTVRIISVYCHRLFLGGGVHQQITKNGHMLRECAPTSTAAVP